MVKVVLADDEEFVRFFLKTVMESLFFDVVAEVEKGDDLVDVMENSQPDILLLDINMPNLTGIEFLKEHAYKFPDTCIIILTSSASSKLINESTVAGARCFLRKDASVEKMVEAIQSTWVQFSQEKGKNVR